MNVEKTIEFILNTQAGVSVQLADLAKRQARTERQIHGLQVLVKAGMKMLAKFSKEMRENAARTDASIRELTAAQKRTDERFDKWLRGQNGNGKRHG